MTRWAFLTGEYPPQRGGVSDYSRLIAEELVKIGDEVHVWCPPCATAIDTKGVQVHRLPDHFGLRSLVELDRDLIRLGPGTILFVHYVPHAFGYKAMNVPFCLWLWLRWRRRAWVLFHEVAFPLSRAQTLRHNFLGLVTRFMARVICRAAGKCFVSTSSWNNVLLRLAGSDIPIKVLPIGTNLPLTVPAENMVACRKQLLPRSDSQLIGHFSSFGMHVSKPLAALMPAILEEEAQSIGLLVGRGSQEFASSLLIAHPHLRGRIIATGDISATEAACHLAACDLLLQPYEDGVSGRRTSLLAGLALGRAIVTTDGYATEHFWRQSNAVCLAPAITPERCIALVRSLLQNSALRHELGLRAATYYQDHFALAHAIETLQTAR